MERKTQTGYLGLADISGYTSFVARTEIEHAGLALSYLLETLVEEMSWLLTISNMRNGRPFKPRRDPVVMRDAFRSEHRRSLFPRRLRTGR